MRTVLLSLPGLSGQSILKGKAIKAVLLAMLLLSYFWCAMPAFAKDWQTVGAGNATCKNWGGASSATKKEILSWMAGFASSENLSKAADRKPEWRMDLLTYEYLSNEIDSVYANDANKDKSMFSILMDVLVKLPSVSSVNG